MIKDFPVTEHFTYFELTVTHDHPELQETNREFFLETPYYDRLKYGAEYLLENVRDDIGLPIMVNSGGRCPALNVACGGVPTSQHLFDNHMDGAFDFTVLGMEAQEVATKIHNSGLSFYQMRVYVRRNFIHLGMPRRQNNMQIHWIGDDCPDWATRMVK